MYFVGTWVLSEIFIILELDVSQVTVPEYRDVPVIVWQYGLASHRSVNTFCVFIHFSWFRYLPSTQLCPAPASLTTQIIISGKWEIVFLISYNKFSGKTPIIR